MNDIVVSFYFYFRGNKGKRHTSWLFINITVDMVPWQRSFCQILHESRLTLYHRFLTTSHVATNLNKVTDAPLYSNI